MDQYQERYLEHQERKKETLDKQLGNDIVKYNEEDFNALLDIMTRRRSQRLFNDVKITDKDLNLIEVSMRLSPSSCNRQAVYGVVVEDKDYIANTLVGAKNWANNADKIILLFASKEAYKNPVEQSYMPYLDTGFVAQNVYLMCEVLNIGCCFVNPNIREENKEQFNELYGNDYFGGVLVLGHYDKKAIVPPIRQKVLK